jgi:hypothetical protein
MHEFDGFVPSLWPNRHETNRVGATGKRYRGDVREVVNDSMHASRKNLRAIIYGLSAPSRHVMREL